MVNDLKKNISVVAKRILIVIALFSFSCDYIVDPPPVQGFGLPAYHLKIDTEDVATLSAEIFSNKRIFARLQVDGEPYSVMVRHQGFTSRTRFKPSYNIKFEDHDPFLQRREVILSSQVSDPSMLRSTLSLELFRESGLLTVQFHYVVLYINDEYKGLYLLMEQIDEEFFRDRGRLPGSVYKAINASAEFSFGSGYDVRYGFEKRIIEDGNYNTLEQLVGLVDNESDETFASNIEKLLDVQLYLKYLAFSVLTDNTDGYYNNFHLYHNPKTKKFEILPWDLDYTFYSSEDFFPPRGANKLSQRLLGIQQYRQQFKSLLSSFVDSTYSILKIAEIIQKNASIIEEAYSHDRWFESRGLKLREEADKLLTIAKQRQQFLQQQLTTF